MRTYIVLLRGVNVGGKNILPMKDLTTLLEENGFRNVKTYIQSGNVILQSRKKPTTEIATAIEARFGFKPEIVILEKSELELSVKNNPYSSAEGKSVHLYFCSKAPRLNLEKLEALATEHEEYQLKGTIFYFHAPNGIGRSKLAANIESCLGVPATGRNINTVTKLKQMVENA